MPKFAESTQLFWKKKRVVSYFLSILVFMIHISSFVQYPATGSTVSSVNDTLSFFFKESITAFAVPMFFMLSGMTFFRNYDNSQYFSKLKSRCCTLLMPYLAWNILWMIFDMICSYSFISVFFIGRKKFELTFINILEGIFLHTCTPFWFIFNLMVFIVISPIIDAVIRNRYVGFCVAIILSVLLVFDIGLPASVFFARDSIVYFLVGSIFGKHYFSCLQKKTAAGMQAAALIFLSVIIVLNNVCRNCVYAINPFVTIVINILCAVSVWILFDAVIDKMKDRPLYSRSFYVYAMHINVSAIIAKLTMWALPENEVCAAANFVITVILTLVSINAFCIVIEKYFPTVNFVLSGHRRRA